MYAQSKTEFIRQFVDLFIPHLSQESLDSLLRARGIDNLCVCLVKGDCGNNVKSVLQIEARDQELLDMMLGHLQKLEDDAHRLVLDFGLARALGLLPTEKNAEDECPF